MPASRPRRRSGMVWFQMTSLKMPLIMSAKPAMISATSAHLRLGAKPSRMMPPPQPAAARQTAAP